MARVGVIIQARMTSTRLPGKVLKDIGGYTLLEYLILRLGQIRSADVIVIATSTDKEDDDIITTCESMNVSYYRGKRDNVLERFVECAQEFDIDIIIRVCSDCPFVDPVGIENLISAYHENPEVDLIHNKHKNGYPFGTGVELVTLKALEISKKNAVNNYQKEHVLPYVLENPDKFKIITIDAPEYLFRPNFFLTIDYPEDLQLIRQIIKRIKSKPKENVALKDVIRILDERPNLLDVNSHLHLVASS